MSKIIRTSTVPVSLELFCKGLLQELSEEYEVIAISSPGVSLNRIEAQEGVRTIPVLMQRKISPFQDLVALWKLTKIFHREKPDMVHSITPKAGLLSMMAGRIAGVPVRVHMFTGLIFPSARGFKRWLFSFCDKVTCWCATHILAEGEGVKNDLQAERITRKKIRILGNGNLRGIDLKYYEVTNEIVAASSKIRDEINATDETFVFLFVGRIVADKGIELLVDVFEKIDAEGNDVRLLFVGELEKNHGLKAETVERISQSKHIYLSGWKNDIRPYYVASNALVFPSFREGFPNVVIEAGAMNLPSIVTDINGSREIIEHGVNGSVIPPKDAESLYREMKRFISERALLKKMGAAARPLVAERYEQGFVRSKLKEFYKDILH